jgi:CHASE3 domain sensor protein
MAARYSLTSNPFFRIAWVVVPFLLIAWSAYLTLESQRALTDSRDSYGRAVEVRSRLRLVYMALVDAETGQRGFLLTSSEAYLDPYKKAVALLPAEVTPLRAMVADDPTQVKTMNELDGLISDKIEELGQTVRFMRAGDAAAALALVKSDRGRMDMDRMRTLISQLAVNSDRTLAGREAAYELDSRGHTRLAFMLVAANGVFALIVASLLWRLKRIEPLVTICAWSRTIEYQGEWMSFEEYLKSRFDVHATHGISPAESKKFKRAVERTPSSSPFR